MTLDDLRALADEFFEWPIAHNKSNITMTSALLFAQHVVQTRETQLRTEYSATMTTLRDAAKQALEALEISYDVAKAEADRYHTAMAGFRPEHHAQLDADVQQIAVAITALRAALEQPDHDIDCHAQGICQRSGYSIGAQPAPEPVQ